MRVKGVLFLLLALSTCSVEAKDIIVGRGSSADFRTIQEAINSLPDSAVSRRTIYIQKGIYNEKLYITKHLLSLVGESREGVIIEYATAREAWRCQHPDDWGVATLNVGANDLTLQNLTIINSYGFDSKAGSRTALSVTCPAENGGQATKTVGAGGHEMAVRTMAATRMKAINCRFASFGGDTMSPWNTEEGYWYFRNCIMEGSVDLYCPRGWAWAENCRFYAYGGDAIIWHDGSGSRQSKTVLKNCSFGGYDGFKLGRYHRDAQFYLIGCRFDDNILNRPIFRVNTTNNLQWGHRVYYYNCSKPNAPQYAWYQNNLPPGVQEEMITPTWVFDGKWDPASDN